MTGRRRGLAPAKPKSCANSERRTASLRKRNPQGGNEFLRAGERPATPLICAFIAEHRARFGVVPICRVLTEHGCKIAPRTFYAWQRREPSKRALWDMTVTEILAGYYEPDEHGRYKPESLYGATKMWAHLQREGIEVARCTVERLMRANGRQGVVRTKKVRTTVTDPDATRPLDLVDCGNLAALVGEAGDSAGAADECRSALAHQEGVLEAVQRCNFSTRGNLAGFLGARDPSRAVDDFRKLVTLQTQVLGAGDRDTLISPPQCRPFSRESWGCGRSGRRV